MSRIKLVDNLGIVIFFLWVLMWRDKWIVDMVNVNILRTFTVISFINIFTLNTFMTINFINTVCILCQVFALLAYLWDSATKLFKWICFVIIVRVKLLDVIVEM